MRSYRALSLLTVTLSLFAASSVAQDRPQSVSPSVTDEQVLEKAAALGVRLREKAAEGDRAAQSSVGRFLEIAGHYTEAAMWFRKAAEQGDASAQGSLGNLYRSGQGVPQDFPEAYKWSRAAADQGDPLGEFNLAGLNSLGQGRPVDMNEAVKWARGAAEQDCPAKFRVALICASAQGLLGAAYLAGLGVPQDYVLAHMWANLAVAKLPAEGDAQKTAIAVRDDAARSMTPEQIGEAQRLAREWKPSAAK